MAHICICDDEEGILLYLKKRLKGHRVETFSRGSDLLARMEGGVAVALAEMAFAGGLGMSVDFTAHSSPAGQGSLDAMRLLFSESNTRFVIETGDPAKFEKAMKKFEIKRILQDNLDHFYQKSFL